MSLMILLQHFALISNEWLCMSLKKKKIKAVRMSITIQCYYLNCGVDLRWLETMDFQNGSHWLLTRP